MNGKEAAYKALFECLTEKVIKSKPEEYFFETVIGCDQDFLEYIKDRQGLNGQVYIQILIRLGLDMNAAEVIKIRNRPDVKKILVFANQSLKDIDSLKDIGEDEINELIDISILKQIIKSLNMSFLNDKQYLKFCDFLQNLLYCIKPDIFVILHYLEEIDRYYQEKESAGLAFLANRCLFVFSMWSSASKKFLTKGAVTRIYLASKPANIHKKVTSIRQITDLPNTYNAAEKNIKVSYFPGIAAGKKILINMLSNQEYQKAYENIFYEYVESLFGKNPESKGGKEKGTEKEPNIKYVDTYLLTLEYLADSAKNYFVNIDEQEISSSEELDEEPGEEILTLVLNNEDGRTLREELRYEVEEIKAAQKEVIRKFSWSGLEDAQGNVDQVSERRAYSEFWNHVTSRCDRLQLSQDKREDLKRRIDLYSKAWINLKNTNSTPGNLQAYVKKTERACEMFYKLAQSIMLLKAEDRHEVASSGILKEIITTDMIEKNENLYISCYNPLMMFFIRQIYNRNRSCLEYYNKGGRFSDYQVRFLKQYNQVIPNDVLQIEDRRYMYVKDNKKSRFPYYLRYKKLPAIASMENISLLNTLQYIVPYIAENPYKSRIRLCIVGEIDLESSRMFVKKLSAMKKKDDLEKFVIQIVTKSTDSERSILEEILDFRQGHEKDIELKIENLGEGQYHNLDLSQYIRNNDIVFLLDCSFMYYEAKYHMDKSKNVRNLIQYQNFDREKEYLGIPGEGNPFAMSIIPEVINCFLNSERETELFPGVWNKYLLNARPMMDILGEMEKSISDNKEVVFFSSDEHLSSKLSNYDYLNSISEGKNGDRRLKIIAWKNNIKKAGFQTCYEGRGWISIRLSEVLNAFPSEEALDESYSQYRILVFYKRFPDQLTIQTRRERPEEVNEEECDKVRSTVKHYVIDVLNTDFWLLEMAREVVLQIMWNASESLEDLMFVYGLKHKKNIKIVLEEKIEGIPRKEKINEYVEQRTWNDSILQFMDILEKESFNPHMRENIDDFLKNKNNQMTEKTVSMVAKYLSAYDMDEEIPYMVKNITEYEKRKREKQ